MEHGFSLISIPVLPSIVKEKMPVDMMGSHFDPDLKTAAYRADNDRFYRDLWINETQYMEHCT